MNASPPTRIVLTGFMGTGKTTVGRALAARLGYRFVDTDQLIEDRHGPIPDLFADEGEAAFRALERTVAAELSRHGGLVIATGGRLMLDERNASALGQDAVTICLTATADEIVARLGQSSTQRPLLAGPDPRGRVVELLEARRAGYDQFAQVSTSSRSPEDVVEEIIGRLAELDAPDDRPQATTRPDPR